MGLLTTFGLGQAPNNYGEHASIFGMGAFPSFIEGNDIIIVLNDGYYRVSLHDAISLFEEAPTNYVIKVEGTVQVFELVAASLFRIDSAVSIIEVDKKAVSAIKIAEAVKRIEKESAGEFIQDEAESDLKTEATSPEFNPRIKK